MALKSPSAFSEDEKSETSQGILETNWEDSEGFLVLHGSFEVYDI